MTMHVRLVDDSPEIALWLKQALELTDLDFDIITTTREFERLLTPAPWEDVDIAVVDIMLPGLSGKDILRYLANVHPAVRRIAITASVPSADEVRAEGLADVVIKPFDINTLRHVLERA